MQRRRFLFLDIDGVLNYRAFLLANRTAKICSSGQVDPDKVQLVNQVVEATGCEVVVSSTWRLYHGLSELQAMLDSRGARFKLIGATPDCGPDRGTEIRRWLELSWQWETSSVAIVDDDSDMGEALLPRLVKTSFDEGLLPRHVDALVALLQDG